jgi:protein-disulfide isomerase
VRFAAFFALLAAAGSLTALGRSDVTEGNPGSRVKVVIYGDFQCSDCARLRALLDEKILPKYGQRVAFVHHDFPLARHDWARPAAIAGRWVWEQNPDAGIAYRREIMAEQDNLTAQRLKPWLQEFARRYRLDDKGILASLNDSRLGALVDQDMASGSARSVSRIPAVFLGNQAFIEIIIEDDLVRAIDDALK